MGDTVLDKDVSITRDDHKGVKKLFKKISKRMNIWTIFFMNLYKSFRIALFYNNTKTLRLDLFVSRLIIYIHRSLYRNQIFIIRDVILIIYLYF